MLNDLMEHPNFDKFDTSSLKSVGGGGAPTPASQVAKADKKFKNAKPGQGWGLTETNGGAVINSGDNYLANPTSCGQALPVVQLKTVDVETGADMQPAGAKGELCVKSVLVMREYWNKPEATAKELTKDGWFKTGDIAEINEQGFVFILDRAKDLIIRGGENISCAEIEGAFAAMDAVHECCAFGVKEERLGEEVGVMVHFKAGQTMEVADMIDGVKGTLAKFKVIPDTLDSR
jgi:acyl-CoA synthetase (AMP-forming)/AMP-acid ligase II